MAGMCGLGSLPVEEEEKKDFAKVACHASAHEKEKKNKKQDALIVAAT